jgi:hypothetical protein
MIKKSMEKYNCVDALISEAEQGLRELVLNFGIQFAYNGCQRITLSQR